MLDCRQRHVLSFFMVFMSFMVSSYNTPSHDTNTLPRYRFGSSRGRHSAKSKSTWVTSPGFVSTVTGPFCLRGELSR